MSGNLAYELPAPRRRPEQAEPARYIEIAPTRSQRRARPRLAYAMVVVGGLFAVLLCQLLLSIALADGAYEISALQAQKKELARDQQVATEQLNLLNSPQNLAARAESLGMVSNTSAVYLDLATGAVMGVASAASADAGSVSGPNGTLLIPNSLIGGLPEMTVPPAADEIATAATVPPGTTTPGAPATGAAGQSVTSYPNGIPAPVTR